MTLNHFFPFFLIYGGEAFSKKRFLMVIAIFRRFGSNLNDSSFFFFVCLIMVGFFTKVLNIIL